MGNEIRLIIKGELGIMRYFYEDCVTGEIYVSDKYLNEDELYCKECDDWDNFLGAVENGGA